MLFIDIDSFKQVSDAVTTAARELGISVVADGVEDTEQLAELRRAGCGYAQGVLFSGPRPATQIAPDAPDVVAAAQAVAPSPGNTVS